MVLSKITDQYAELWKAIIRPPRDEYEISELGPQYFQLRGRGFQRSDFQLRNARGLRLQCSHFEPVKHERRGQHLPCLIYLHGNCSSRCEALSTLAILLPLSITVLCFDFSGSGLSDGHYVSLGYWEKEDLATVVEFLRKTDAVSTIGLWGRSMGSATALLHSHRDPSIAAIVLDSAFTDLRTLAKELVDVYINVKVPRWIVSILLGMVRNSIKSQAHFDIYDLTPIRDVGSAFIPALFAAARDDTFIKPHHTKAIHEAYAGDKNLVMVDGDHNSPRSTFFLDSVAIFFYNTLQCDAIPTGRESVPGAPSRHRRRHRVANAEEDDPVLQEAIVLSLLD